jgi:hypothetical protein
VARVAQAARVGKIVGYRMFTTKQEALEAAGLRE